MRTDQKSWTIHAEKLDPFREFKFFKKNCPRTKRPSLIRFLAVEELFDPIVGFFSSDAENKMDSTMQQCVAVINPKGIMGGR